MSGSTNRALPIYRICRGCSLEAGISARDISRAADLARVEVCRQHRSHSGPLQYGAVLLAEGIQSVAESIALFIESIDRFWGCHLCPPMSMQGNLGKRVPGVSCKAVR